MAKEKIFIIGSGGHAKVVIDIIETNNEYKIEGIIDFQTNKEKILGYLIINNESILNNCFQKKEKINIFIAVGENFIREKEFLNILQYKEDLYFPNVIHNSSIISKKARLGKGVFVGPGVIINTDSVIGDFTLINTKASIDHDCMIGNFSSIGPGSSLGGKVTIGDYSHIGLGANILEKINIGENSLIGAGSLINKDIANSMVVYGVPGKIIRQKTKLEKIYK